MQNHPHPRLEQLKDRRHKLLVQRKDLRSALRVLPPGKSYQDIRQDMRARLEGVGDRLRNIRHRIRILR